MFELIFVPFGDFAIKLIITIMVFVFIHYTKVLIADKVIYKFAYATHQQFAEKMARPISKIVAIITYTIFLFFVLWFWDFNSALESLLFGAGLLGIVVGFAAKDMLGNVLAGIMLFFDKPFKIGDTIKMGDMFGRVIDIGLRSTKIKTFDNRYITVPNGLADSTIIENLSKYETRRFDVEVGVDYDTDIDKAKKSINNAMKILQKKGIVLKEPSVETLITKFSDSSIVLEVRYWVNRKTIPKMLEKKSEVIWEIRKQFKKDKILIPFPQVTISNRKKR
jgi:small conductance mechanosensitive channel